MDEKLEAGCRHCSQCGFSSDEQSQNLVSATKKQKRGSKKSRTVTEDWNSGQVNPRPTIGGVLVTHSMGASLNSREAHVLR